MGLCWTWKGCPATQLMHQKSKPQAFQSTRIRCPERGTAEDRGNGGRHLSSNCIINNYSVYLSVVFARIPSRYANKMLYGSSHASSQLRNEIPIPIAQAPLPLPPKPSPSCSSLFFLPLLGELGTTRKPTNRKPPLVPLSSFASPVSTTQSLGACPGAPPARDPQPPAEPPTVLTSW